MAIGGRAAMQAQSSSHATGTISLPSAGMTGTVEVFSAKPNKALIKMTRSKIELKGKVVLDSGDKITVSGTKDKITE